MKISQTGTGAPAARSRKTAASGSARERQDFSDRLGGEPASAPAASTGAAPLAALSGLLAIQESPDFPSERRKTILHGDTLLDELKQLQLGLVQGSVSEESLHDLSKLLNRQRPPIDDDGLNQILDEIEVRAAVELAKLESRRG